MFATNDSWAQHSTAQSKIIGGSSPKSNNLQQNSLSSGGSNNNGLNNIETTTSKMGTLPIVGSTNTGYVMGAYSAHVTCETERVADLQGGSVQIETKTATKFFESH
jgi:hypothetical protein